MMWKVEGNFSSCCSGTEVQSRIVVTEMPALTINLAESGSFLE
jgi:hypothetical protein